MKNISAGITALLIGASVLYLSACATQTEFSVKDLRETTGSIETQNLKIDNASGADVLRQDQKIFKNYRHMIDFRPNGRKQIDESRVRDKIYDLYKLTPNEDKKTCVVPVEVPAGRIFLYDIEWTQIIREGKVVEASSGGDGEQLGTYTIITDYNCQTTNQTALK